MKRRTYLGSIGVGAAAFSGGIVLKRSENGSEGSENQRTPVVYEHEDLRLETLRDSVSLGETVRFEVTNTGDSTVVLGCDNAWIVQTYSDGEWRGVTDTPRSHYQMCALELPPGESRIETATMSKEKLETQTGDLLGELRPGRHRFVLLETDPRLAADFRVTPAE
ncbi:hypothetical protein M0R88_04885 [Halorussus gelatinilyticus]|uniref:Uncharacterized protein n=1 Tax=Halorussus gelatinilyticus TaxID=2937524 RepID=A0A8U0IJY2_9EURY|nr:hypothetical protein [Halorussus gelatinilyticus]UPW01440.1 hypothetical protein M0R88_04885 [Halorussus gelatinilyticus]